METVLTFLIVYNEPIVNLVSLNKLYEQLIIYRLVVFVMCF